MVSISVTGHSGYGVKGEDIVCAGISTLVQTLLIGLEQVLHLENVKSAFDDSEEKPFMKIGIPDDADERTGILTKTVFLSLKEIERVYPKYVRITEVQK